MTADPLAIVLRDGKKVDALTDGALKRAEKRLGRGLTITQGSYNPGGVAASAGAHDKGGTVDLPPWDWREVVPTLRAVGFAAWHRAAVPGLWPEHIHAVLIGHPDLAPVAARQVPLYLNKRDGLKSNGPDTDPGWTATARYTVALFRADVERAKLDVREAKKRGKIAALWEQIKAIRERRRSLPR